MLDRTELSPVLREQELALAGVVSRETGPEAGRMVGAEVIIKGAVTEFEPNKRGGGLTVGAAIPSLPFGVRLGRNGSRAHVGLDISVVDASTGQVTAAHRVTADSKSGGWTLASTTSAPASAATASPSHPSASRHATPWARPC